MADGNDQTSNAPIQSPSSQPKQPSTPASSSSSDVRDARSLATPENSTSSPVSQPENRAELIERARSFLTSPQIRHEDLFAKRRFLAEKGLSDAEIAGLLQELPVQAPLIPPRTYPPPPPSNLPNLLVGLLRIFTWVAGGSATLLLIYYRYLLPLLSYSYQARFSIKAHQKDLLARLTTSIESLKDTQSKTFSVLPKPKPFQEDPTYKDCHTLDAVVAASQEETQKMPSFSVLRCAIEEFATQGLDASTEALFRAIEAKFPSLNSEHGAQYQNDLWQTLTINPLFSYKDTPTTSIWSYAPPAPPTPTLLASSLTALHSSFPTSLLHTSPFQHTLGALSDLTGYITTQLYSLPSISPYRTSGFNAGSTLGPEEEELRREIRALKGLVLNRRVFDLLGPFRHCNDEVNIAW